MQLIYDIDNNCSNLRDLAIALKPIHKRFGIDMKIGISQTDLLEEGHCFDKSLYKHDPRNKDNFIVRHYDDIAFYPATTISEECKRIFAEKVVHYTKNPPTIADKMRKEVLANVFRYLQRINPKLLSEISDYNPSEHSKSKIKGDTLMKLASSIDLNMDRASPELYEIILSAFHNSGRFRGMVYNEQNTKEFFKDVADKEKRLLVADSLYAQGVNEKTNFVMVIGDIRHHKQMEKLIDDEKICGGYTKKGRSFIMLPEDFVASCKALHTKLSKLPTKTDSMRQELDALGEAINNARTQFDGHIQQDYCKMALNNRYKDWGISIHRY